MFNRLPIALAAAAAVAVSGASAQDRTIVTSAPTADEYVDYLFTDEAPAEIKTRGVRTRGIQMTGAATTTAPAASPAPSRPAAAAPTPAPKPAAAVPAPKPAPKILAAPVNFGLDSAAIPAEFGEYLVNLAEAMKRPEAAGKVLVISGHTDSQGSDAYNLELSVRRANAVEAFLRQRGVPASQLVSTGKGERELLPGREQQHAMNRRVEFTVAG